MEENKNISRIEVIHKILKDNYPSYVFEQIIHSIYKNGTVLYSDISNVKLELRDSIVEALGNNILNLTSIKSIKGLQVEKILFNTKDNQKLESVRMIYKPNKYRNKERSALCISSQVGCAMGCKFCVTGAIGFKRNLSADEITDQLLYFVQQKTEIDSVFFSGMGEPLVNPEFYKALDILMDYFKLSQRKISVSTCGIVPGIERISAEYPQINIALSLHSAIEKERELIMPISKAYPLDKVFLAIDQYIEKTNRKVFIAYILLDGVNDSMRHADALVELIKKRGPKSYLYTVNLIKFHPGNTEIEYKQTEYSQLRRFCNVLESSKINYTIRQDFGLSIEAACGQLYAEYPKK
jgi:23S rRNA (adenine-C8)-methyltransferase